MPGKWCSDCHVTFQDLEEHLATPAHRAAAKSMPVRSLGPMLLLGTVLVVSFAAFGRWMSGKS